MIDHSQEKRAVADQWSSSGRGTAVTIFPVFGLNKRDMAATSSCDALKFMPNKRCFMPKNHDKSLHTGREQLCYRSLSDRKASQADQRFGHGRTSAAQAAPLPGRENHSHILWALLVFQDWRRRWCPA